MVVGEIEDSEVGELGDVPADLAELVVREVKPLKRVHPAIGTADGEVRQLVHGAVQLNLGRGEDTTHPGSHTLQAVNIISHVTHPTWWSGGEWLTDQVDAAPGAGGRQFSE